jgi:hypothetical protein
MSREIVSAAVDRLVHEPNERIGVVRLLLVHVLLTRHVDIRLGISHAIALQAARLARHDRIVNHKHRAHAMALVRVRARDAGGGA